MMAYWEWWVGALALGLITFFYHVLVGRRFGVSAERPEGSDKSSVLIFDTESGFIARGWDSPTPLSRGEFGLVGAERILAITAIDFIISA